MSILTKIQQLIENTISAAFQVDCVGLFSIDVAEDTAQRGEITTNAAMVLAKKLNTQPKALAELLKNALTQRSEVDFVDIAGPGFINITLKKEAWLSELDDIVRNGDFPAVAGQINESPIHIEFVSANPTGPMHAGHVRNAIFGDTIASLLEKMGHKVHREYYINDAGKQIEALGKSLYWRYMEARGQTVEQTDDMYPGEYLAKLGQKVADDYWDMWRVYPYEECLEEFKEIAVSSMMNLIRRDLAELDVHMDYYASEKAIIEAGKVDEAIQLLERQGDVYTGVLTPPKGVDSVEDWEERPQMLFKATKYGDDMDRPLRKSDGTWTYFATDIAYQMDKMQRGFRKLINVFGADHCGYVKRITAATKAIAKGLGLAIFQGSFSDFASSSLVRANSGKLGQESDEVLMEVKLFQIVNFFENGQPIKMSKRAGTFITSRDIVNKVGMGATRFMMVSRHNDTVIDFDFQKVLELSQDNPIFYIQYAHSRICSVFRNVAKVFPDLGRGLEFSKEWPFSALGKDLAEDEIAIVRRLSSWPKILEQAAVFLEPHRISSFLYTLATDFHRLWTLGKRSSAARFINEQDKELTIAKITLLQAVAVVLRSGLGVLGIATMYRM
ncbi:MAG: arginine--tRNA ligase [Holosporales bacterium]|jgi:arginyl-tRNA synthetase|nr:arginine--tRNA ligase [Holosporales bacterium]